MPRGLSPAGVTRQTAASTWSGLTEDGEAAFHRLRSVAIAFDQRHWPKDMLARGPWLLTGMVEAEDHRMVVACRRRRRSADRPA
jgi:hypothetical protein